MKAAWIVLSVLLALALAGGAAWLWTPDKDRAALEARYLAAPADLREIAGARLHVRDSGPRGAPPVILIHGLGSSLQTWDGWVDGLSRAHRVIRFDLPGSGLSAPDAAGDYGDERGMLVLQALMDALGVGKASIVGHSIGGRLAWRFAAAYPERVDKLVLVSPDGFASPGFAYGERPKVPQMLKLMRYALPMPLLRMSLAPAYADPATISDALATRHHDLLLGPGVRDAMIARMEQTVLVDPLPLLRTIRAPTLLVWGERDAMIPFANAEDYRQAIALVILEALSGVGHVPQEEAAQRSLAAVASFLRRRDLP